MLNWPQKYKVIGALSTKIVEMVRTGDFVIKDEITYFEKHGSFERTKADSLYSIFEDWARAQNPPIETTNRNFFRMLFCTIGRLKAHKKIMVKVSKADCSLCIFNLDQPHV